MTLDDLVWLQSDAAASYLAELTATPPTAQTHLALATRLREAVGAERAHALLETALLREKGGVKFSRANEMFFERAGLEMSSAEIISTWRAKRYAGLGRVVELGCGIGGDAIGLTAHVDVVGVDRDRLRLALAAENVRAYGRGERFEPLSADIEMLQPFPVDGLFFDPARRDERGRRIFSLAGYRPPLTVLDRWRPVTANWGIKVSPGVKLDEVSAKAGVEFISVKGELREAVLWYGDLRPAAARTATLLPAGVTMCGSAENTLPFVAAEPASYLYEPDPAVIRAGLVRDLGVQLNAGQLDDSIAFLTSDQAHDTPFARQLTVLDWFPFQLKRLRRYLRERKVGRVTIKKRGSPLDVDQLRRQLKLKGKASRIVVLTQLRGEPIVIICA